MAIVSKIDSNVSGLTYEEEATLGVLPGSPIWKQLEPNSFTDFGQTVTTVARKPITASRQAQKGVTTDFDAAGGFQQDLTQENMADMAQGFFFADLRKKDELLAVATVDGAGNDYEPAAGGDGYVAGDLLFAQGFDDAANNGLKEVSASAASTITVVETIVTAATQDGTLRRVGFKFAAADAVIDDAGALPALTTTAKDLTTLGLVPGEFVFIGGDVTANQYATAADNGFARVRSISTNSITFDKTSATMVADVGSGKNIHIYFAPRIVKNESVPASIIRRSYQIERTLGAPDDASPAQIQSEYLIGAVPGTMSVSIPTADKITADLAFTAMTTERRTGATGVKAGARPALIASDAFNTSSDIPRIKLAVVSDSDAAPSALFAYVTELSFEITNNLSPAKAVGVTGAFDITAGMFGVSGSMTAYFADVAAVTAVAANSNVTLDAHIVKANKGVTFDLPLITLGDGKPSVEADQPITLPLTFDAAAGASAIAAMNHTMLMQWWDYLPNLAG